jgi:DNA-directed RNA polymerase subunit M/transcription elongation factor TFIIS
MSKETQESEKELDFKKIRQYVCEKYSEYVGDIKTAELLENKTYKVALERSENMKNYDIDHSNYKMESYIQTYIKVLEHISNKDNKMKHKVDILSIPSATREELSIKWSQIFNERNDQNTVIKKKGTHQCKCGSWYTSYQQLQTRSSDEAMTINVVCLDCGHHWKYS